MPDHPSQKRHSPELPEHDDRAVLGQSNGDSGNSSQRADPASRPPNPERQHAGDVYVVDPKRAREADRIFRKHGGYSRLLWRNGGKTGVPRVLRMALKGEANVSVKPLPQGGHLYLVAGWHGAPNALRAAHDAVKKVALDPRCKAAVMAEGYGQHPKTIYGAAEKYLAVIADAWRLPAADPVAVGVDNVAAIQLAVSKGADRARLYHHLFGVVVFRAGLYEAEKIDRPFERLGTESLWGALTHAAERYGLDDPGALWDAYRHAEQGDRARVASGDDGKCAVWHDRLDASNSLLAASNELSAPYVSAFVAEHPAHDLLAVVGSGHVGLFNDVVVPEAVSVPGPQQARTTTEAAPPLTPEPVSSATETVEPPEKLQRHLHEQRGALGIFGEHDETALPD